MNRKFGKGEVTETQNAYVVTYDGCDTAAHFLKTNPFAEVNARDYAKIDVGKHATTQHVGPDVVSG